jgi:hypothetical protein
VTLATEPRTGKRGSEKPEGRIALERPYERDHTRSTEARFAQPTKLRDYVRELMDAWETETKEVTRLHQKGVEWSQLGTPRWTRAFHDYVTGNDCDTTREGEWRWPLRSSIFRMSISRSGRDRLGARFVFLLMHNRFHVGDAWAQQCGLLADPAIADAADDVALAALIRWWGYYLALPEGKPLA